MGEYILSEEANRKIDELQRQLSAYQRAIALVSLPANDPKRKKIPQEEFDKAKAVINQACEVGMLSLMFEDSFEPRAM